MTVAEIERDAAATVMVPKLIGIKQVAALLGVSRRHLAYLVHAGDFPKPLKIGTRSLWKASEYAGYVERLRERQAEAERKRRRRA